MDVDPDCQMESCSSATPSNATIDDKCKTSNSWNEFAYPQPIRRYKKLQKKKEELGGQEDMDVDPNRQMESCSSAASSNATIDDKCKTTNSWNEFAYPQPIRRYKKLQKKKEKLDPNRQMVCCCRAASSNATLDDKSKTSNSCEEFANPEPTCGDKELQEEQEEIKWVPRTLKQKLIANGEMDKLRDDALEVLLNEKWNLVIVEECRQFISQYGKGVTYKQLYDHCKVRCMKHVPEYVMDHLLKKIEQSEQKEVKKKIKKVKKQKQVEEPKEVMQSEEVEKPKEVMQSEEVEEPKEVMQSEEVEEPKKVTQSEKVEQPKEDGKRKEVEKPEEDNKPKKAKIIKKVKKGNVKKQKQVK